MKIPREYGLAGDTLRWKGVKLFEPLPERPLTLPRWDSWVDKTLIWVVDHWEKKQDD